MLDRRRWAHPEPTDQPSKSVDFQTIVIHMLQAPESLVVGFLWAFCFTSFLFIYGTMVMRGDGRKIKPHCWGGLFHRLNLSIDDGKSPGLYWINSVRHLTPFEYWLHACAFIFHEKFKASNAALVCIPDFFYLMDWGFQIVGFNWSPAPWSSFFFPLFDIYCMHHFASIGALKGDEARINHCLYRHHIPIIPFSFL